MTAADTHGSYAEPSSAEHLWAAEDAARELPELSLEDALQLVHVYAERGSPKYEKAGMRWFEQRDAARASGETRAVPTDP